MLGFLNREIATDFSHSNIRIPLKVLIASEQKLQSFFDYELDSIVYSSFTMLKVHTRFKGILIFQ